MLLSLHNLPKITDKKKTRVGRGKGSSRGKTSGRGSNGQRAHGRVTPGFEGGQTRLLKRLRTMRGRGFKGRNVQYEIINLDQIDSKFKSGELVSRANLIAKGLITKASKNIKILGQGDLTKKLKFAANLKLSQSVHKQAKSA